MNPAAGSRLPAVILLAAAASLAGCGKEPAPSAPYLPPTQVIATDTPPPDYPLAVACAGVGGTSLLDVVVGVEGKPTQVQLVQSSGNAALDQAAQARIPEWQFKPATRNGQPVPTTIRVPVNFKPPAERPDDCFRLD